MKDTHRGSVKDGGAVRLLGGAETSRSTMAPRAHRVSNATESVVLTLDELRQITNNFSDDQLLGEGGFGKVYKGVLTNGDIIAVKRFASTITGLQDVQYENEAQHLMRLMHPNIVQLVGHCSETETEPVEYNGKLVCAEKIERLLCLEYMPKGSLRDHLSDETSGLEWNTRYKIIEGICYGLHYLHEEWQVTPIIHMDLKPANILLDDNMVPKIADFGLSRLFGEEQTRSCTTNCKGTRGYMAPEYIEKGVITKKFDIFSLGVIIIEIITGLKDYPTDETETKSQQYIDLVLNNWRWNTKAQGYTSQDIDYQQIKKCIQIGLLCVKVDREKRPTINQIIKMLERSDAAYQNEREEAEGFERDRSMILNSVLASMASSLTMFMANLALAKIGEHRVIKGGVNRLKKNCERLALMMESAEGKVMLDDEVTRYWLKRFKDHMYQVEDIVDQWIIKNNAKPTRSLRRTIINFGDKSGLMKVAAAIVELNVNFESILKLPVETKTNQHAIQSYGKTAPDYNADIVGDYVDSDASNIVELLHSPKKKCRLIAIVGMVGIGKTTLARRIYQRVKVGAGDAQHFETKLWIHFSYDLSSLIMWSDCLKEGPTKAQLQNLAAEIANKKFLLVVDSVWTENIWEALEGPLQQGNSESSRVIVTTRNKHIAKRIGADRIHYVKRMNNIDALSLLFQRASISENDEADLKDIAQQIVRKCDGLPLAVRSIGRTLRGQEPTRHDWETACRTAFQDLSPEEQYMINLSFQNLPYSMRQCFLYCSVFPEDFFIEKQYIIQQLISEGFIEKKRKFSMEEVAEDCFHELIGRGLLHLEFGDAGVTGAKMPIMIRSFAKDVSDYENFCNESVSITNLFEARRLSIVENNEANDHNDDDNENGYGGEIIGGEENINDNMANNNHRNNNEARIEAKISLHGLRRMKYLRTLVLHKSTIPDGILVDMLRQLNLLRVLDLRGVQGIRALPVSIGSLEHLRYLNISETMIGTVPESIVNLIMLQYLLLRNCSLVKTLPKGIGQLRHLRCLDISGTGIRDINWSFSGMEELVSMQGFPVGDNIGSLQSLDLRFPKKLDILCIDGLEEILEPPAENEWPIIKKYQLKELELCYINYDYYPLQTKDTIDKRREVLDMFVPHERLEHLKIKNYIGKQYPSWISTLSNLQQLHLQNCELCDKLPSLGELPQLKFLAVTGFDNLWSLGMEFRGDPQGNIAFRMLQQLFIGDMRALHTWSDLQSQDLPQLQILRLLGCTNLKVIPLNIQKSTTLTRLEVDTKTKIMIQDNLRGFTQGTVINITNTWEPQQDEIVEALVTPPNAQPPQQDEIVEAAVAPRNERPGRFKLLIIAFFALLLLLFGFEAGKFN